MLGFDRRAARIAWTVSLVAIALYLAYAVRRTAFVFVLALFFSYLLYPLVKRIAGMAPLRWSKGAATAIVYVLLLGALAGIAALVGPPIVEQASALSERLPRLLEGGSIVDKLPLPGWLASYRDRLAEFARSQLQGGSDIAMPIAKRVGQVLLTVAGNLIYVVLIPVLAFLLIKDGTAMRDRFLAWTRRYPHAGMWRDIVGDLDTLLGGYMRALLILSLGTIVVYAIVFSLAGVPYGLLLAVLAGLLEFVPVLGPLAAAVASVAVAALSGYDHVLAILGFIVLYRVFQDYVLNPYLMHEGVTLPPLLVLFGLLAGEELAGVAGIFLSVPVLAAVKIAVRRIGEEVDRGAAARAGTVVEPPVEAAPPSAPAPEPIGSGGPPAAVPR